MTEQGKPTEPREVLRFDGRFQASEITRAFASSIRALAQNPPQSEVSLKPETDEEIVRGVD